MIRTPRSFWIALIAILLLGVVAGAAPAAAQSGRQVYAFYFGWWTGDSWGDGRLLDRPANPYDSRDGGALGRQIDEARGAGIDAFIMSWYGPKDNNLTQQSFNALLDQAAGRGFKVGAAVDLNDGYFNASVEETLGTMQYLIGDRVNHPAYLRWNGKPVIYFWNQGRYSVGDWQNIRSQVDPGHNTIWVMEGTNTGYLGVFDSLYLFNVAWSGNPAGTAAQWRNAAAAGGSGFYTPTVMPGWDESTLAAGRPNPTDPQSRAGGQFLTNSWNGAVASGAETILIVSWNEYFENSHIEPSQSFGTLALDTLRPLIAAWKGGAAAAVVEAQPPAPEQAPAAAPGGLIFVPSETLRLRAAPLQGDNVIGEVPAGTQVAVIGRSGDSNWAQVNFNGATGWVAGWLGSFQGGSLNDMPVTY